MKFSFFIIGQLKLRNCIRLNCPIFRESFTLAPLGGFKQSGIGRQGGVLGLEKYIEAKAIIE
jgi:acyl-CoA reductase-like NAD-dependent aldehyde dehydrogenase